MFLRPLQCFFSSFLAVLFFLSLNAESPQLFWFRAGLGGLFILLTVLADRRALIGSLFTFPVILVLPFAFLSVVKGFYGALSVLFSGAPWSAPRVMAFAYMESAVFWVFVLGLITASRAYFTQKDRVLNLIQVLVFCSVLVSLNIIPKMLLKGSLNSSGVSFFFPEPLYGVPFISKILLGQWISENWAGDFVAFGFFSAVSLGFYDLYRIFEKRERLNWVFPLIWFLLSLACVTALLLLKSRGTVVCFAGAFLFYLAVVLTKMPFRGKWIAGGLFLVLFLGAAAWGGNLNGVIKEVQTLHEELTPESRRSLQLNIEAAKRAKRMLSSYPLTGVGRGNYRKLSEDFAESGTLFFAREGAAGSCQSHYLQTLAEEGWGGVVYFLFLAGVCAGAFWKVFRTRSCFQLLAGLALLAPFFLVLGHAAINDVMDRFSMAMLVYFLAGTAGGLLSSDFKHEVKTYPK